MTKNSFAAEAAFKVNLAVSAFFIVSFGNSN